MNKEAFYITTPIYYGNGVPHIGHTYSSIIANIIYKYNKISGKKSRFTTGIDENSQKAVLKAEENGMTIMDYLDEMALKHKSVWDFFNIDYTDFIRTTEERHHILVKKVLQKCFESGDIYSGIYEGMYCVGCEAFKKEEDLIEKNGEKVCPDHLTEPQKLKEKNYFFRLSKYQTWIEEFYDRNPNFVKPDFRYNEVKAFVSRGLEDFSISRETNTFGILLPFDETQVTYVWFDALFNYYTSCKYSRNGDKNNENFIDESKIFWEKNPNKIHVVGKDIIRFHAIFWPCMLASYFGLGEEINGIIHYKDSDKIFLPTTILTGGFFTVDGQKMSKSLGNVIEPVEYATKYGKELLTLYMLSAFPIGLDGDYDRNQAILTYNAKLAHNLGNLLNRVVVLSLKLDGILEIDNIDLLEEQKFIFKGDIENDLLNSLSIDTSNSLDYTDIKTIIENYNIDCKSNFEKYNLKKVLDKTFLLLKYFNQYIDEKKPRSIGSVKENKIILYSLAEGLRQAGLALYPFFPEKMGEMFTKLGLEEYTKRLENGELEKLISETPTFLIKEKGENLFKKIDV